MLDVGPVRDRQKVLRTRQGERPQAGPEPAGEQQGLQLPETVFDERPMRAIPTAITVTPTQRSAGICSWNMNLAVPEGETPFAAAEILSEVADHLDSVEAFLQKAITPPRRAALGLSGLGRPVKDSPQA